MKSAWALLIGGFCLLGLSATPAQAAVTLQVSTVQGGRNLDLDFETAQSLGMKGEPQSDSVVRQVQLRITSDSSAPYQVFQRINGPWRNLAGTELPVENIRFVVTGSTTGGQIRHPTPTRLVVGEQELFLSNNSGGDETLLITYTVQVPLGQKTGQYRTTLTYRVVSR